MSNLPLPPIEVRRDQQHPWTGQQGWDHLLLRADSREALDAKIKDAQGKFWQVWITDYERLGAFLYKPAGQASDWRDDPEQYRGTPRGHGTGFEVGQTVYTDYDHGRISRHEVVEVLVGQISQTGCKLRIKPAPRGSVYIDDRGNPAKGLPYLDAAWFRPDRFDSRFTR